jgi:hypothetical protein
MQGGGLISRGAERDSGVSLYDTNRHGSLSLPYFLASRAISFLSFISEESDSLLHVFFLALCLTPFASFHLITLSARASTLDAFVRFIPPCPLEGHPSASQEMAS